MVAADFFAKENCSTPGALELVHAGESHHQDRLGCPLRFEADSTWSGASTVDAASRD